MIAGVGHVGSAAAGFDGTGSTKRSASASPQAGRCSACASGCSCSSARARRAARGLGLLDGTVPRLRARRVPHMGWNTLEATGPSAILDGLDGADVYFAHSYARPAEEDVTAATVDHDGTVVAAVERGRSPACSSTPSGAARQARACSRTAAMVKKRVIPCLDVAGGRVVKGVNFANLREHGRPGRARPPLLGARRGRARVPRHHGDVEGRGPILDVIERAADELTIPFTVGGGITASTTRATCCSRARTRSRSTAPPSTTRDPHRARGRVRRAGGRLRDRRARRRGRDARRTRAARARRGRLGAGGGRARRREILLTSIDADGTRAGYDLELTRAVADAVEVPVIASGGAGRAEHLAEAFDRRRRGGARRLDRPRAARAAARAEGRAGGRGMADADSDAGDRPRRGRRPRADARVGWTTRRSTAPGRRARRGSGAARANELWHKGATSRQHARGRGDPRRLRRRRDAAPRAPERPRLPHRAESCFAPWLWRVVAERAATRPEGSYVDGLLADGPAAAARRSGRRASRPRSPAVGESDERLVEELADLWFHCYVLLAARGLEPAAVEDELRRRHSAAGSEREDARSTTIR